MNEEDAAPPLPRPSSHPVTRVGASGPAQGAPTRRPEQYGMQSREPTGRSLSPAANERPTRPAHRKSPARPAKNKTESMKPAKHGRLMPNEYRVELVHAEDQSTEVLGVVDVSTRLVAGSKLPSLADLRDIIQDELLESPAHFVFSRNGLPVGIGQEVKRDVAYIATKDGVITLRTVPPHHESVRS